MWHFRMSPCPLLELDTASYRNGELFWNAEEKLVILFLNSGLWFFSQMVYCGCSERFILVFRGKAMLCCSLLPQLSSADAGDQKAPWNSPMLHSSPEPLGLHGKSRWVHSLEQEVCREVSPGLSEQEHRSTKLFMASAAKFYVCFSVVRVVLLLSFIRHFAV